MIVGSVRNICHGCSWRLPSLDGGMPTATKRPPRFSICRPSSKPGEAGREHQRRRRPHPSRTRAGRVVGAHDVFRAERPHELEPVLADVDTDDPVAERVRDLHGVVAETAGRADDRDRAPRRDAVRDAACAPR